HSYAHLCAANYIRAMPENEIPPARLVDIYLNLDKKIVQYYQNKEGKDEYTVSDMWSGLAYSAAYSI
ncbi:MAG: hypothetical protein KIG23_02925, partial [Erysipelotrichaceae bacterium]|nr:hypothetical protein [Erysipelotrichaceae bacterium]